MKLWGGRFSKETNKLANDFNSSISFDSRLFEEDITPIIQKMMKNSCERAVAQYADGNKAASNEAVQRIMESIDGKMFQLGYIDISEIIGKKGQDIANYLYEQCVELLQDKKDKVPEPIYKEFLKVILLRVVDTHWMDHIDSMDQLRQGIGLRAYGQHDPVVEYRNDSYDMFSAMTDTIREQTAKLVLSVRIRTPEDVKREKVAEETSTGDKPLTVKGKGVVGKNALCPCGSGKKYKKCCGR